MPILLFPPPSLPSPILTFPPSHFPHPLPPRAGAGPARRSRRVPRAARGHCHGRVLARAAQRGLTERRLRRTALGALLSSSPEAARPPPWSSSGERVGADGGGWRRIARARPRRASPRAQAWPALSPLRGRERPGMGCTALPPQGLRGSLDKASLPLFGGKPPGLG